MWLLICTPGAIFSRLFHKKRKYINFFRLHVIKNPVLCYYLQNHLKPQSKVCENF